VIDYDMESDTKTCGPAKYMFLSFYRKVDWRQCFMKIRRLYRCVRLTIKCNKLQSISEITELIFVGQNKIHWPEALVSAKIPVNVNSNYLETVNVLLLSDPKEHF